MKITKTCLFIFLVSAFFGFGQKRILKQANVNFELREFHKASDAFEKAMRKQPLSDHDQYKYCLCEYQLSEFDHSQKCFQSMIASNRKFPISLYYFLAKSFRHENEIDSAIIFLGKYIDELKLKKSASEVLMNSIKEYEALHHIRKVISTQDLGVVIKNLGANINSKYPEYGPVLSYDEKVLYFTSCRPDSKGGLIDPIDGLYHEDIYMSVFDSVSNRWSTAASIENVNSERNDAVLCVNKNQTRMYLYRHGKDNVYAVNSGDLYMSEKIGNIWQEPVELKELNTEYLESSAAVSPDESFIIFSSDRPGGKGGQDLYISKKLSNGNWGEPVNLFQINTKGDDDSPYLHTDGVTLYYSTNGLPSYGGYDVYFTKFDPIKNSLEYPVHVPFPISTLNDDLYFGMNKEGTEMLVSYINQSSYGYKDLYRVDFPDDQSKLIVVNGKIKNDLNQISEINDIKITVKLIESGKEEYFYTDSSGAFQLLLSGTKDYIVSVDIQGFKPFYKLYSLSKEEHFMKLEDEIITLEKR